MFKAQHFGYFNPLKMLLQVKFPIDLIVSTGIHLSGTLLIQLCKPETFAGLEFSHT